MIYVGTCGFSYKDWIGAFYPVRIKPAEMLGYYARRFAAVEIDSSAYGVPTEKTVASMMRRTPDRFRLTFKAPQTVTHPPDPNSLVVHDDAKLLVEAIEPAVSSEKFGCVLLQFPNGFKAEGNRREYLANAVEAFGGLPVVVEFRNDRWQTPETMQLLRELGAGYCNVDMPRLEGLLHASSEATSEVGYVRFHGRSAKTWWRGTNVTRYDYLYSEDELAPWADRIADVEAQTRDTYVMFNNHANGKAAKNAEMMEVLLEQSYGDAAPETVAKAEEGDGREPTLPGL
ncbi:MAG TPA: DUF72 domain-containing protein [Candidatus Baltobacteraceae bacterium]|nr:DUF72 domain-containing protein [Candidatus Baltobacteraceae bacterium]